MRKDAGVDDRHHACQSLYPPESAPRRFRSEGNGKPDGRMAHPLSRRRDGRRWDSMSHNSGDEYAWLSAHGYGKPSARSEEHTSELQSLMRISYAVFCLKKTKQKST